MKSTHNEPTVRVSGLKVGARFEHRHWLDASTVGANPKPQVFQVTRIAQGIVYFRPVYNYGSRESLGAGSYRQIEQFESKDVLRWLKPDVLPVDSKPMEGK